ncbi:MAG: YifB family Mg chelatase-like AAA ATPase [Propionibacterium sp.]|nr:YifB family Mg chelatase-like AAA ATPase [Propionibacterium sp.]
MNANAVASALAVGLVGLEGHLVEVETHVGRGLVSFTLVGLPDTSVRESRERVRAALQSCGLESLDQRTTVSLSPADLPKSGSGFDLAVAVSILVATAQVSPRLTESTVFVAELGLDGSLRSVPGVLPCLVAASRAGVRRAVVAASSAHEAGLVPGVEVLALEHLADVVGHGGGEARRAVTLGPGTPPRTRGEADPGPRGAIHGSPALAEVRGQPLARRAAEVAAAGGHHLFLVGEAGSGKTMLANRLTSLLPDLDDQTALTVTSLHSVAGLLSPGTGLVRRPPFQAPHHSATMPSLIGGGVGMPRPGAVSLAHGGVLLLDEAAEFSPVVLDALRQPLEEGVVRIHRSRATARYPASFQLVMATNPCPCGRSGSRTGECTCSSLQRRRYVSRLSGPLLDRVDIRISMHSPSRADLALDSAESSQAVARRVREARERARQRWAPQGWAANAQVPGPWLREHSGLDPALVALLDRSVDRGVLSMRGADRVLRLAWTVADLADHDHPDDTDLAHALALRKENHRGTG